MTHEIPNLPELNRDPLTGAPGAHPVGTGACAVAGGIAGAAAGSAAGPIGTALGAVVGAVAGGLAGKGAAESVYPTNEEAYWRHQFQSEPYYAPGKDYDYYAAGYETGWEGRLRFENRGFDEAEEDIRLDYDRRRNGEAAEWIDAREAARAAWNRVDSAMIRRVG